MKRFSLVLFLAFVGLFSFSQALKTETRSGLKYIVQEKPNAENLVILIHGYGSNERDLMSFQSQFENANVICLQGWIELKQNSFAWYKIEFRNDGNHQRNLDQGLQSVSKISTFIESMTKAYMPKNLIIGGFSQGAIMSARIALEHPDIIDGAICLSGMLLDDFQPLNRYNDVYKKLSIFYGHGTNDKLLPINLGLACSEHLKSSGMNVTFKEYPTEHRITQQEVADFRNWYRTNFL